MQCTERPERIEVHVRHDGIAECAIRRNIHQVTDAEGNEAWEADEVQFTGNYTAAQVEANEDELWRLHDPKPIGERIASEEGITAEHDDAIIELYEMMIGE